MVIIYAAIHLGCAIYYAIRAFLDLVLVLIIVPIATLRRFARKTEPISYIIAIIGIYTILTFLLLHVKAFP